MDIAAEIADRIAAQLTSDTVLDAPGQNLAHGAAGIALLHVERAHRGLGTWQTAHDWITRATCEDINGDISAGLYSGAPAISFLLHAAGPRYEQHAARIDASVISLAHRRVEAAYSGNSMFDPTNFGQYDVFRGLTGIGRLLLEHHPGNDALGALLDYVVGLTHPAYSCDEVDPPGWWVGHDPDLLLPTPGGHANLGLAHGITGPLALLALALRRGVTVFGHADAIRRICTWLDTWQQCAPTGPWWPQWITRDELRTQQVQRPGPLRPSWCYGTPGIARALQIAGIALGDTDRQHAAETALDACLSDPDQLAHITDPGLCHGWAGLYQTTVRAATDSHSPALHRHLPRLAHNLIQHAHDSTGADLGFLTGATGTALALHTVLTTAPFSEWSSCLLID